MIAPLTDAAVNVFSSLLIALVVAAIVLLLDGPTWAVAAIGLIVYTHEVKFPNGGVS